MSKPARARESEITKRESTHTGMPRPSHARWGGRGGKFIFRHEIRRDGAALEGRCRYDAGGWCGTRARLRGSRRGVEGEGGLVGPAGGGDSGYVGPTPEEDDRDGAGARGGTPIVVVRGSMRPSCFHGGRGVPRHRWIRRHRLSWVCGWRWGGGSTAFVGWSSRTTSGRLAVRG